MFDRIIVAVVVATTCFAAVAADGHRVLGAEKLRRHFARFNADDTELYRNAIPNDQAIDRFGPLVPWFECPDDEIERIYYYRWWVYRKHLRQDESGWAVSEYLPSVNWSGKHNTIACPFGHHVREGRWLRDGAFIDDYVRLMLKDGNVVGPRAYLNWPAWSALERAKVTGDFKFAENLLPQFVRQHEAWEKGWTVKGLSLRDTGNARHYNGPQVQAGFRLERGLFDYVGDREGSEFALSLDGARPMVNAAMWAECVAIAELAARRGDSALAGRYRAKAEALATNIRTKLWNPSVNFFVSRGVNGELDNVRELHGYAPFYFGLPLGTEFDSCWAALMEAHGFLASKGLTFPAQDAPGFAVRPDFRDHACMWNGPSWPYATTVALTALYRRLQRGDAARTRLDEGDFVRLLRQYAAQHYLTLEDGRRVNWIDENLDAFTGEWLARKVLLEQAKALGRRMKYPERGKDYNHSAYCDLVIAGLCGFVPRSDGRIEVRPLVPKSWNWWCVDGIRYHGHDVAVLFDRDGTRYGKGKGLVVLQDDKRVQ